MAIALTPLGARRVISVRGGRYLCRGGLQNLPYQSQQWFSTEEILLVGEAHEEARVYEIAGLHFEQPPRDWCGRLKNCLLGMEAALSRPMTQEFYAANELFARMGCAEEVA